MPNLLRTSQFIRSCSASAAFSHRATENLRALLRETAQPVAVVTSFMPPEEGHTSHEPVYHGATLSSFTSIAMEPVPLVTFALRIPSRMASTLNSLGPDSTADMVINILSAKQADIATRFSRPDLHPHPFSATPYFLSPDGLPIIRGSLGAISCKLVSQGIPLHDLRFLQQRHVDTPEAVPPGAQASQLFIAQVTRLETMEGVVEEDALPLLYHRRRFTSCIPGDISTTKPP